jgi:7-cyano-7-deazaguanine reductase
MSAIEGKVLGKQVSHPKEYAPEILVAVPRYLNREQYGINENDLPFTGVDAWHAYELGFLTENGLPVAGVLKLVYDCNSEFLVESKSLKLYLNSFNMGRYGNSKQEGIVFVTGTIKRDLSYLLNTEVGVEFHENYHQDTFDFEGYTLLEGLRGVDTINFASYKEDETLLMGEKLDGEEEIKVSSHLLRSNCKITQQPDWGSVFIHIKSNYKIDQLSLLAYLVSVRDENHFHEEICEMLIKRLMDKFSPESLMVACLYTRRGGIDICPVRANKSELLPQYITQEKVLSTQVFRQ